MSVTAASIFELVTAPDAAALRSASGAVWLWEPAAGRPVWANGAALRLLGADDHATLLARAAPEAQPGLARLSGIAGRLPLGASRIERVRLFLGGRAANLTCRCAWLRTRERKLLAVTALDAPGAKPGPSTDAAGAARDLLAGLGEAALALDAEGGLLYANAAARAFGPVDTVSELTALAALAGSGQRAAAAFDLAGRHIAAEAVALAPPEGLVAVRLEARGAAARPPAPAAPVAREPEPPASPDLPEATDVIFRAHWDEAGRAPPEDGEAGDDEAGNVLPFRGSAAFIVAGGSDLSAQERYAFRALADALGARMEGDEEAPPADRPPAEAPAGAPGEGAPGAPYAPALEPAEAATVLSRLPLGLMVYRRGRPLYANRALLDLFGFATFAELAAFGSIAGLLPRLADEDEVAAVEPARDGAAPSMLVAHDRAGQPVPVIARLQAIRWGGEPAILLTVRAPDGGHARPAPRAGTEADGLGPGETRAALALAADGTLILDRDGRITALDSRAQALFGLDARAAAGMAFEALFAADSRTGLAACLDAARQCAGPGLAGEGVHARAQHGDGGEMALHVRLGRLGEDAERAFCAVVRDTSPEARREAEMARARETAEEANRQKSEFLARVSHEIRTPLNSIIGFAELMQQERLGELGHPRYRDYLRDIVTSGHHLLGLVNDLVDLSKIEAGKLELNFTGIDVNDVAVESIRLMLNEAARGRVIVRSSLGRRLPAVLADQRSLKQILLNLLSNAIKFTLPGGQVVLSTRLTEGGEVQVRVRDTGVGMEEQDVALAMEPFRQVAVAAAPRTPGSGLGLPLTRALAQANRARFHIESASGRGTLTEVTFPAQRVLGG